MRRSAGGRDVRCSRPADPVPGNVLREADHCRSEHRIRLEQSPQTRKRRRLLAIRGRPVRQVLADSLPPARGAGPILSQGCGLGEPCDQIGLEAECVQRFAQQGIRDGMALLPPERLSGMPIGDACARLTLKQLSLTFLRHGQSARSLATSTPWMSNSRAAGNLASPAPMTASASSSLPATAAPRRRAHNRTGGPALPSERRRSAPPLRTSASAHVRSAPSRSGSVRQRASTCARRRATPRLRATASPRAARARAPRSRQQGRNARPRTSPFPPDRPGPRSSCLAEFDTGERFAKPVS